MVLNWTNGEKNMELIPNNIKIPKLYEQDGKPDEEKVVPIKLFQTNGSLTWFITEYDPETKTAFETNTTIDKTTSQQPG